MNSLTDFHYLLKSMPIDTSSSAIKYCRMSTHIAFLQFFMVNLYVHFHLSNNQSQKTHIKIRNRTFKNVALENVVTLISIVCSLSPPYPVVSGKLCRQDRMSIRTSHKLYLINSSYLGQSIVKEVVVRKYKTILPPNKDNAFVNHLKESISQKI